MTQVIITNTTTRSLFVSGRMLPPGCSVECPVQDVPAALRKQIPADAQSPQASADDRTTADQDDWSAEDFLSQSLRDMEDAGLNELETGQLTELKKLESDGQNRQNVLTAIDAALLKAKVAG